ncbi:MAG: hypothetical protein ACFB12_03835 [Leptolyngbyaceae cyanobacterium]
MVCPNQIQVRQQLESLYQRSSVIPAHVRLRQLSQQVGQWLIRELTRDRTEPQICQDFDEHGRIFWRVYDPLTRQRDICGSEREVRMWLERRYAE